MVLEQEQRRKAQEVADNAARLKLMSGQLPLLFLNHYLCCSPSISLPTGLKREEKNLLQKTTEMRAKFDRKGAHEQSGMTEH